MADVPVQMIVAAFQDERGADHALEELKRAKKDKLVDIKDAAVLRKDLGGDLHINDTGDMTGTRGGVIGGAVGVGLAVLTGGAALPLLGLGAATGGIAAKLRDSGFEDDRLRKLGTGLKPGSSALVAVIEHNWVDAAESQLRSIGGDVVVASISADMAEQLAAGNEVGYTAVADSSGAAAARIVTEPGAPPSGASASTATIETDQIGQSDGSPSASPSPMAPPASAAPPAANAPSPGGPAAPGSPPMAASGPEVATPPAA
jgi:uncharacterized membrane protein